MCYRAGNARHFRCITKAVVDPCTNPTVLNLRIKDFVLIGKLRAVMCVWSKSKKLVIIFIWVCSGAREDRERRNAS
jgi:hypothetical protein